MPLLKGNTFTQRDVFVDYPSEKVMFRWDHKSRKVYYKPYGKAEGSQPIPHENSAFNDALLYGREISESEYLAGRHRE